MEFEGKSDLCYNVLYSQVSKNFNAEKSHSRKLHVHVYKNAFMSGKLISPPLHITETASASSSLFLFILEKCLKYKIAQIFSLSFITIFNHTWPNIIHVPYKYAIF